MTLLIPTNATHCDSDGYFYRLMPVGLEDGTADIWVGGTTGWIQTETGSAWEATLIPVQFVEGT